MAKMLELKIRVPESHLTHLLEFLVKLDYVEIEQDGLELPHWEKDILDKVRGEGGKSPSGNS